MTNSPAPVRFDDDRAARQVEACYLTPDVVAHRDAVIDRAGPRPGEHVIDVGSGPGLLVHALARAVAPAGRVLGVDASPNMVAMGRRRCEGLSGVSFEIADAGRLPAADASSDLLTCTQVLEYVRDVEGALAEFRRVLRPRGRTLIMDTDWASCVWRSGDDDRMRRMLAAWDTHCPQPRLPRMLPSLLAEAGFEVTRAEVLVLLTVGHSENSFVAGMEDVLARHAVRTKAMSAEEASAWRADLAALGAAGRYFFSLNRYVFVAERS